MGNVYYDTEFLEDGKTIELISIGMVNALGETYYAISEQMPMERILDHPWLMENVMPHLPKLDSGDPAIKSRATIADEVKEFITRHPNPKLWAWYGAYDHVVLCQLFGTMVGLHDTGIPMFTNDLRQAVDGFSFRLPKQVSTEHNALDDAMWVKDSYEWFVAKKAKLITG